MRDGLASPRDGDLSALLAAPVSVDLDGRHPRDAGAHQWAPPRPLGGGVDEPVDRDYASAASGTCQPLRRDRDPVAARRPFPCAWKALLGVAAAFGGGLGGSPKGGPRVGAESVDGGVAGVRASWTRMAPLATIGGLRVRPSDPGARDGGVCGRPGPSRAHVLQVPAGELHQVVLAAWARPQLVALVFSEGGALRPGVAAFPTRLHRDGLQQLRVRGDRRRGGLS